MVTTTKMRDMWSAYRCLDQRAASLRKPITLFGRNAGFCAAPMFDAFIAAEMALKAAGYSDVKSIWIPRNCPTGISGKKCAADGTNCSLHNYGVAFDIDPFGYGNPHFYVAYGQKPAGWSRGWDFRDIKLTRAQVEAVEAIKNTNGEQMFRWLGWLNGDTMHFEGQVPPSRCLVDWNTVLGFNNEEEYMIAKWLTEEQWRRLYRAKVAKSSSEDALVQYWVTQANQRTDQEFKNATAAMFTEMAERGTAVDKVARAEAASAQAQAAAAHSRLDKLRSI